MIASSLLVLPHRSFVVIRLCQYTTNRLCMHRHFCLSPLLCRSCYLHGSFCFSPTCLRGGTALLAGVRRENKKEVPLCNPRKMLRQHPTQHPRDHPLQPSCSPHGHAPNLSPLPHPNSSFERMWLHETGQTCSSCHRPVMHPIRRFTNLSPSVFLFSPRRGGRFF